MNLKVNDNISEMKISTLTESMYLKPMRAEFQINGKQKYWDFLHIHDSVSILIYNTNRKVLVFVRQFRPALYLSQVPDKKSGTIIDTQKYNLLNGYSLELCSGLVDKTGKIVDIAKDEILEECGYDVPVNSLKKLFSFRGVGITGQLQTLYYVEVNDDQKVSSGGGLREEGEFIEVVELTIPEVKNYINSKDMMSPPAFLAAVQWFFQNIKHE
ncbi:uridine diphosphate glucose pyrophosphatase, putative [Pediculus humanus corporis]|uniref:Uridine diphosphate glucose pyrophosphatase NUDT14 n=1 Tax=Pediculus humanus subsp. corporis TaxID=121224 RepID=E0VSI5_PEDHC|nr:uridine diphosphate glucose pyrophosphatase, putative [Pediculus humanus corporis]EEB16341.1 uridine diphosphate glucose pyrophosphatase, putative [Pediculus humanus corporis]